MFIRLINFPPWALPSSAPQGAPSLDSPKLARHQFSHWFPNAIFLLFLEFWLNSGSHFGSMRCLFLSNTTALHFSAQLSHVFFINSYGIRRPRTSRSPLFFVGKKEKRWNLQNHPNGTIENRYWFSVLFHCCWEHFGTIIPPGFCLDFLMCLLPFVCFWSETFGIIVPKPNVKLM